MNNHGNRNAPRFTSLHTKKRTKYRRQMLAQAAPIIDVRADATPKIAAMPGWFVGALAMVAKARDLMFSRPEYLSSRQRRAQAK